MADFSFAETIFDGPPPVLPPESKDPEFAAKVIAYDGTVELGPLEGYDVDQRFRGSGTDQTFLAFGLTSETGEPILAIRGTAVGAIDWYENSSPRAVGLREAAEFWPDIRDWLQANPGAHITGHSQGGAQAQMFAAWATHAGIEIGRVETFNSPGIAQQDADVFRPDLAERVIHHVSQGDMVSLAGEVFLTGTVNYYNINGSGPFSP